MILFTCTSLAHNEHVRSVIFVSKNKKKMQITKIRNLLTAIKTKNKKIQKLRRK